MTRSSRSSLIVALAVVAALPVMGSCRQTPQAQPPASIAPSTTLGAASPTAAPAPQAAGSRARGIAPAQQINPIDWEMAIARIEEPRGGGSLRIPAELRHYDDQRRFLAIQIADATAEKFERPHDHAALAQMIQRGDLEELPLLGQHHILYEVGTDARENPLAHYDIATGKDVRLFGSAEEYEAHDAALSSTPGPKARAEQESLAAWYKNPDRAQRLFAEHKAVTSLAANFGGTAYDLSTPQGSAKFQQRLMGFLRPAAREIVLQIAQAYHQRFGRLLPASSLIRTERYQRRLARVNANATRIDIPPHTTGMAFDVSYKFMSHEEQVLVMEEVARLESQGRVEALRERNNAIHVYAFGSGRPPAPAQVASYLEDVRATSRAPARAGRKARAAKARNAR